MKDKLEVIKQLDSLLSGEHNLNEQQRNTLIELRNQTKRSKTYGNLKSIGLELLKIFAAMYKDP